MEATPAVEKHTPRETALQRLVRNSGDFLKSMTRMTVLTALVLPILLLAFLTVDLPVRAFDGLFGDGVEVRASNWLTRGAFLMGLAPLFIILIARKYGGDEASRVVTAAWGVAAVAVFAELSYLSPELESGDLPGARFVMAFVASAMAAQYIAASVYDVARGATQWWRAPLYGAIGGSLAYELIYFPWVYWGSSLPWGNWMVGDFAIKMLCAFAFLPVYGMLRRTLKPKGGFGG